MKRVLVVDDSTVVHAMIGQVLRGIADCRPSYVRNGLEALSFIAKQGEPNLILLDVNMPVMDGLECLDELRSRGVTARVPVVIVTTEGKDDDIARGLGGGAREYVTKPFDADALRGTVSRLLEGPAPAPEVRAGGARKRILLVDDSQTALSIETALLIDDYDILTASDGARGVELALTAQPDLVVLDMMMPGLDGLEACRRLRQDERTRRTPIIFATTRSELEAMEAGYTSGCSDYVVKPIDRAELRQKVRSLLSV